LFEWLSARAISVISRHISNVLPKSGGVKQRIVPRCHVCSLPNVTTPGLTIACVAAQMGSLLVPIILIALAAIVYTQFS
jgi:hypothetical protein